ncbi:MAG: heat-inducible transcriptional repressor HrcA [Desulfuromonadia bacterium]
MYELNARSRQILEALIDEYIASGEPVGSRTISRRQVTNLSPASVRNVMADLEEQGYLDSPHTSAGRVPTDKAYRFYVDRILSSRAFSVDEQELKRSLTITSCDPEHLLHQVSRALSALSHYVGMVVAPALSTQYFRQIELISLGRKRVLVILVSTNGTVQNRLVEVDQDFSPEDLVRMGNYLNTLLRGLSIGEVKRRIREEMESDKARYDALMERALAVSQRALETEEAQIFIEGQLTILEQPEFADVERMREIFRGFEEKSQLLSLLDRCCGAEGVRIFIGSESKLSHLEEMSLITAPYRTGRQTFGVLGVIGPRRMGYARVIPIVDYAAHVISRIMGQMDTE